MELPKNTGPLEPPVDNRLRPHPDSSTKIPDETPRRRDKTATEQMTADFIAGFTITIQTVSMKYPDPDPIAAGAALVHMLASFYANIPNRKLRKELRRQMDLELSRRLAQLSSHMERTGQ